MSGNLPHDPPLPEADTPQQQPENPHQKSLRQLQSQFFVRTSRLLELFPELCDVTFLVGREEVEVRANSTVLALGSDYFKAMLFGPHKNDLPKVWKKY